MGVSHRPGFGLLGSVPRSLSTQPPFATQALTNDQISKLATILIPLIQVLFTLPGDQVFVWSANAVVSYI